MALLVRVKSDGACAVAPPEQPVPARSCGLAYVISSDLHQTFTKRTRRPLIYVAATIWSTFFSPWSYAQKWAWKWHKFDYFLKPQNKFILKSFFENVGKFHRKNFFQLFFSSGIILVPLGENLFLLGLGAFSDFSDFFFTQKGFHDWESDPRYQRPQGWLERRLRGCQWKCRSPTKRLQLRSWWL